jgi:O-antigen/teichoic acid export membrane protein
MQLAGKVVTLLLSYIMIKLMTTQLGEVQYGIYSVALTYAQIVAIIGDFGIGVYLLRLLSDSKQSQENQERLLGIVSRTRVVSALLTVSLAITIALLLPYGAAQYQAISVALVAVIFQMVNSVFVSVLQSRLEMKYAALSEVSGRVVMLLGSWYALISGYGVVGVLVAQIVGNMVNLAVTYTAASRYVRPARGSGPRDWWPVIVASYVIGISSMLSFVYFKFDTILLSLLPIQGQPLGEANNIANGYYGAAYRMLELLIILPGVTMGTVFPLVADKLARGERAVAGMYLTRAYAALFGIGIAVATGFLLFAPSVIQIVASDQFLPAVDPLRVLAIAMPFNFLSAVSTYGLLALKREKQLVAVYAVAAILNVGANVILIPHFSYMASAWITVATELFVFAVSTLLLLRQIVIKQNLTMISIALAPTITAALIVSVLPLPELVRAVLYALLLAVGVIPTTRYLLKAHHSHETS